MDLSALPKEIELVSDENIGDFCEKNQWVVVVAGAAWCSDTKRIIYKALPPVWERHKDKLSFAICLVEDEQQGIIRCPKIKEAYQVDRYPTIVLLRNGQLVNSRISEKSSDEQMEDLEALIREIVD